MHRKYTYELCVLFVFFWLERNNPETYQACRNMQLLQCMKYSVTNVTDNMVLLESLLYSLGFQKRKRKETSKVLYLASSTKGQFCLQNFSEISFSCRRIVKKKTIHFPWQHALGFKLALAQPARWNEFIQLFSNYQPASARAQIQQVGLNEPP